jgi:hypothetical protein
MFNVRFERLGITVMKHVDPEIDLTVIGLWRPFAIGFSVRNRWIEIVRCSRGSRP